MDTSDSLCSTHKRFCRAEISPLTFCSCVHAFMLIPITYDRGVIPQRQTLNPRSREEHKTFNARYVPPITTKRIAASNARASGEQPSSDRRTAQITRLQKWKIEYIFSHPLVEANRFSWYWGGAFIVVLIHQTYSASNIFQNLFWSVCSGVFGVSFKKSTGLWKQCQVAVGVDSYATAHRSSRTNNGHSSSRGFGKTDPCTTRDMLSSSAFHTATGANGNATPGIRYNRFAPSCR